MAKFRIEGDQLILNEPIGSGSEYSFNIRATNSVGSCEQALTIQVVPAAGDGSEVVGDGAPTTITLSNQIVAEGADEGDLVGTLSSDGAEPITFTIAADPGSKFMIPAGTDKLRIAAGATFTYPGSHSVTVQAANSEGSTSQSFDIAVTEASSAQSATWTDNTDGRAHVFLGTEPDYVTTLEAEYDRSPDGSVWDGEAALSRPQLGTAGRFPLQSTCWMTGGLGAGTHHLCARWVADRGLSTETVGPWSDPKIVEVSNVARQEMNRIVHPRGIGSEWETAVTLNGTYEVGQFVTEEYYVVHPGVGDVTIKARSPKLKWAISFRADVGTQPAGNYRSLINNAMAALGVTTATFIIRVWLNNVSIAETTVTLNGPYATDSSLTNDIDNQLEAGSTTVDSYYNQTRLAFQFLSPSAEETDLYEIELEDGPEAVMAKANFQLGRHQGTLRNGLSRGVDFVQHALSERNSRWDAIYKYTSGEPILPGETIFMSASPNESATNNHVGRLLGVVVVAEHPPAGSFPPSSFNRGGIWRSTIRNKAEIDYSRVPAIDLSPLPEMSRLDSWWSEKLRSRMPAIGSGSDGTRMLYPTFDSVDYHAGLRQVLMWPCIYIMGLNHQIQQGGEGAAQRDKMAYSLISREIDLMGMRQSRATGSSGASTTYDYAAAKIFAGYLIGDTQMRTAQVREFATDDYLYPGGGLMLSRWSDLEDAADFAVDGIVYDSFDRPHRNIAKPAATTTLNYTVWEDCLSPRVLSLNYEPTQKGLTKEIDHLTELGITNITHNGTNITGATIPANRFRSGKTHYWDGTPSTGGADAYLTNPLNADTTYVRLHSPQATLTAMILRCLGAEAYWTASERNPELIDRLNGYAREWMLSSAPFFEAAVGSTAGNNQTKPGHTDWYTTSSQSGNPHGGFLDAKWIDYWNGGVFAPHAAIAHTVPSAFTHRMVTVEDAGSKRLGIKVHDIPHDGYSPLTSVDFRYSSNDGADWSSWGSITPIRLEEETTAITGTGSFLVQLRATNPEGSGPSLIVNCTIA